MSSENHYSHCSSETCHIKAETQRGGQHDNLVSTLTLTQCDPLPPLKNPGYALLSNDCFLVK